MTEVPDHNAARWLVVRWLEGHQGRFGHAGWYVVRICPCHWAEPVTLPLPTEPWAQRCRQRMLEVAS
jgi:hypothetical protein